MWRISEKRVLVTGATTGIGRALAVGLARRGAEVIVCGRSSHRVDAALAEIVAVGGTAEPLVFDLTEPRSVVAAARRVASSGLPLHGLVNNAGVGGTKGVTAAGVEIAFATNHLGHFQLTRWLVPLLVGSAPARVVIVASSVHAAVESFDWSLTRGRTGSFAGLAEYRQSKLANMLFGRRLSQELDGTGVDVSLIHPGLVASDIFRDLPGPVRWYLARRGRSTDEGADTALWALTEDQLPGRTGRYLANRGLKAPSSLAEDDTLAEEIWQRSEQLLAGFLPPDP